MNLITKTVLDQHGRPVSGAQVTIRDGLGALVAIPGGNPRVTDGSGTWTAFLEVGTYSLVIAKGPSSISRSLVVHSMDPARTIIEEAFVVLVRAATPLDEIAQLISIPTRTILAQ